MNQLKHILNRVSAWIYFKTMSEYTVRETATKMREILKNRGLVCASCKAEKPLKTKWAGDRGNLCARCYRKLATRVFKRELNKKGIKYVERCLYAHTCKECGVVTNV